MKTSEEDIEEFDLIWCDLALPIERVMRLKPWQRVSNIPGMHALTRKNHLGRNLNALRAYFPQDYEFYPHTWLLPQDYKALKHDWDYIVRNKDPNCVLIVKPEAASQGKGIYLTRDVDAIPTDAPVVV
jgi:tubulin polyglutamylase TTLL6/13